MTMTKIKEIMTSRNVKTILFASLIAAMILPFSMTGVSAAPNENAKTDNHKNPKDKTLERIQEKETRKLVLKQMKDLYSEEQYLKEKLKSETRESEKQKIKKRANEIKFQLDEIEHNNHKRDIPQAQLNKLVGKQDAFEEKLFASNVAEFVTSVGIDITSKEIQIGLDEKLVNSDNIDSIVENLEDIMPRNTKWHIVYSDIARATACNQNECEPVIGGNYIKIDNMSCSYGFQAKKGATWGWITAGHCAEGKVGYTVRNLSGDNIGTVNSENNYWGTYCDCAWITSSSTVVDNKVYGDGVHTITKTTPSSQQQNEAIMKSGYAGLVDFGTVSAIHVTLLNFAEGEYVRDLVRSDTSIEYGDSGGTVVKSDDKGDLFGIVNHADWWGSYHTPIEQITSEMGITPVLN